MLIQMIREGFSASSVITLILSLPIILFALSFHEFAHAFIADKMGDHTARNFGRLTLDPLKHLDPIGALCMLLFGFGWAKPVPINVRYFEKPKKGMALTAIAGPISNLILGFIGVLLMRIADAIFGTMTFNTEVSLNIASYTYYFFYMFGYLNISLAIFNLLPIPPFDGSRLVWIFLPDRWYFGIMKYERIIQIVLLVLLCTRVLTIPLGFLADSVFYVFDYVVSLIPFL